MPHTRYMEAAFLHRTLPAIMIDFFQPRQIMSILMDNLTSFSATDAKSPLMLAAVVDLTFRYLQHKGHQDALVEWVVVSCSTFLQISPRSRAIGILTCLFISVSKDPVIRGLLPSVVAVAKDDAEFDHCLFWLPALHFFLNENLGMESKIMFCNVFSSADETPFAELAAMCIRLSADDGEGVSGEPSAIPNPPTPAGPASVGCVHRNRGG
eukprot:m.48009 g.48009  ORF g.48009 m.48009 type:complete len:210 (-) comp15244_c1_seq7:344-973(-)